MRYATLFLYYNLQITNLHFAIYFYSFYTKSKSKRSKTKQCKSNKRKQNIMLHCKTLSKKKEKHLTFDLFRYGR